MAAPESAATIFSIGHSTHSWPAFQALLQRHGIELLADVRSLPGSRRWPQFNQAEMSAALANIGVEYRWLAQLGGRRRGRGPDSPHRGWQVAAFRAYADYAEGAEFAHGLEELIVLARAQRVAFMCSEGLWWRCHRRLIADRLLIVGWRVLHILPDGKLSPHQLTSFARVVAGGLIYDGEGETAT
ncbi:MAG TPA: DUF488 domain-containing protein [Candidatus Binataceae bacterium]|nr:DUF488 domain-containing protein [Candidatus Binataceae bacterium]